MESLEHCELWDHHDRERDHHGGEGQGEDHVPTWPLKASKRVAHHRIADHHARDGEDHQHDRVDAVNEHRHVAQLVRIIGKCVGEVLKHHRIGKQNGRVLQRLLLKLQRGGNHPQERKHGEDGEQDKNDLGHNLRCLLGDLFGRGVVGHKN